MRDYLININSVIFISNTNALYRTANVITTSCTTYTDYTSKLAVLDKYNQLYENLIEAMKDYRELLLRDTNVISDMGEELYQADQRISNMWHSFIS